jgi:DNA-binding response OmpR family regulator
VRHEPPRVLVAEDDDAMRALVVDVLRKDGLDVVEACDGGRLLVTLAREITADGGGDLVDLVVSDVRMPVCTGMQILEQLRAAHRLVPYILITAFGDSACQHRVRSLGALLIDKPFDVAELRAAVSCLLGRAE